MLFRSLLFIPLVNIVVYIILCLDIAREFSKSEGFAAGLILLAPIFFMILGWGQAEYGGGTSGGIGSPTPAGWYTSPDGSGTRWWDGQAWGPLAQ